MTEASKSKAVATQPEPPQIAEAPDALEQQLLADAKTPQERALAYQLATTARQQTMLRRTAMAVAETGWGKDVSPVARQAVVRYCMEIGADPVRHVHILGGTVYLNAAFWMELVAANPKFLRAAPTEFIHDDDRATPEERQARKARRVEFGVPEQVKGAAVVTLFYAGDRGPFIGVNWAGSYGKKQDPVGDQDPTKTAETRAYRRAAIKAEPAWFRDHPRLQAAQELIVQGRELERAVDALPPLGLKPVATDGGYAEEPSAALPAKVGVIEKHQPNAICGREGEHPREECGHFKAKATA